MREDYLDHAVFCLSSWKNELPNHGCFWQLFLLLYAISMTFPRNMQNRGIAELQQNFN